MFRKGPEILFLFFFFLASLQFPTMWITIQNFFPLKQVSKGKEPSK